MTKKTIMVSVKCTPSQKQALDTLAQKHGVSNGEFLRRKSGVSALARKLEKDGVK